MRIEPENRGGLHHRNFARQAADLQVSFGRTGARRFSSRGSSGPSWASVRPRSVSRRIFRGLLWTGVVLLLAVAGRCLYAFRDRTPGYTFSLDIDGRAARAEPKPLRAGFGRVKISPDLSNSKRPIWLADLARNEPRLEFTMISGGGLRCR
jgi:hypothetical protein